VTITPPTAQIRDIHCPRAVPVNVQLVKSAGSEQGGSPPRSRCVELAVDVELLS